MTTDSRHVPAVCPVCHLADQTAQVSTLVMEGTQRIETYSSHDGATSGTLRSDLATRLRGPDDYGSAGCGCGLFGVLLVFGTLGGMVLCSTLARTDRSAMDWMIPVLALPAAFAAILTFFRLRSENAEERRYWATLSYCHRDDVVWGPGEGATPAQALDDRLTAAGCSRPPDRMLRPYQRAMAAWAVVAVLLFVGAVFWARWAQSAQSATTPSAPASLGPATTARPSVPLP